MTDFYEKIIRGVIKIDEILSLKLNRLEEILKCKNIIKDNSLFCQICSEMKNNLYIFEKCSHPFCLPCLKNYLDISLDLKYEEKIVGNKAIYSFKDKDNDDTKVLCPTCKKDNLADMTITMTKIFV